MSDFSVSVGVCAHRDVKIGMWKSLWGLKDCPNPKINVLILDGDALISRSRSRVATNFLDNTKDEMLMFIDDDVEISTLDATRMMWEVHKNKLDILGAAYVLKSHDKPTLAIMTKENKGEFILGEGGIIKEVKYVSSGCMIIRREVFEKFIEKGISHKCKYSEMNSFYGFFREEEFFEDGKWKFLSEDWFFCQKALDLGFKVWLDTRVKTNHFGIFPYNWDYLALNGQKKQLSSLDFRFDIS